MGKNKFGSIVELIRDFVFCVKSIIKWDRKLLLFQSLFAVAALIYTYVGILIPVNIVSCIEEGSINLTAFLGRIGFLLLIYFICNVIKLESFQYIYRNSGTLAMYFTQKVYKKTMCLPYEELEKKNVHEMLGKVWNVIRNDYMIRNYVVVIPQIVISLVGCICYGCVVINRNLLLLIGDILICVIGALLLSHIKKKQEGCYDGIDLVSRIINYINKICMDPSAGKDIRLFDISGMLKRKYDKALEKSEKIFGSLEGMYVGESLIIEAFLTVYNIGCYIYFGLQVIGGAISVAEFIFLINVVSQFSVYLNELIEYFANYIKASVSINYFRKFLWIKEPKNLKKQVLLPEELEPGHTIEFRNVSYRYPGSDKYILKNINLKIETGKSIAVIGLNGAGKTTLIKLMCGLYTPTEGDIYINDHNISDISNMDKVVAAIFQDSDILPLTVEQNISGEFSDQNISTAESDKLGRVIREADFEKKYKGLHNHGSTLLMKRVNHGASDLSGGEKQKLMFARALYKQGKILILDEPTAALDPVAERKLYDQFSKITDKVTTIFISHRLSSTAFCDEIVLINDGEILEVGTHEKLLEKKGLYAELFHEQSKYYIEEEVG